MKDIEDSFINKLFDYCVLEDMSFDSDENFLDSYAYNNLYFEAESKIKEILSAKEYDTFTSGQCYIETMKMNKCYKRGFKDCYLLMKELSS